MTRQRLSRDLVVTSALELIDDRGAGAFSIRRLAASLGVTPMALYRHVDDAQDVLDGVVDRVFREFDRPTDGPWDHRLAETLRRVRRMWLAHPNVLPLVDTARTVTPAMLEPMEAALDALADVGVPDRSHGPIWAGLVGLVRGQVAYQHAGHGAGPPGGWPADLAQRYPRSAAATRAPIDHDQAFERALDTTIQGLALTAQRP